MEFSRAFRLDSRPFWYFCSLFAVLAADSAIFRNALSISVRVVVSESTAATISSKLAENLIAMEYISSHISAYSSGDELLLSLAS